MKSYVDYRFYTDEYKGSFVTQAAFDGLAQKAGAYIDYVTLGRAAKTELVQHAVCAAVDELARSTERSGISVERVGDHAVHYENGKEAQAAILQVVTPYLMRAGLLSRFCPVYGG